MIHKIIHSLHIYKDFDQYFQLGLIALWETTEKFDEKQGKFESLAYSMIRGRMLEQLKKESTYANRFTVSDSFTDFERNDERSEIPLEKEILLSYCTGLSEKEYTWVQETFIRQKTISDIAKKENVKVETVKTWRKRALQKIRNNVCALK